MAIETDKPKIKITAHQKNERYSVECFHIYTDEVITDHHRASLNYLSEAQKVWDFDKDLIVLIDNYNPTNHKLRAMDVLTYLESEGYKPKYWAFEADFVDNAKTLLGSLTNPKLKRSYERYIANHKKYPCSLLTAAWYLTRLGLLDSSMIKATNQGDNFEPAYRLINILPQAYDAVELRTQELILNSTFSSYTDKIQDLLYAADAHRKVDLF